MRIMRTASTSNLSGDARRKLQRLFHKGSNAAMEDLKSLFPNHVISGRYGHIQVTNKKGSIILDILNDGGAQVDWVESKVGLRMTNK